MAARSRPAATKRLSNVRSPQFRSSLFPNVRRSVAFMPDAAEPLLSVRNLKKYFPIRRGILSRVVDHVKAIDDMASGSERNDQVAKLLTTVGLDPSVMNRYPHEFSGGQRQRIGIARALALKPKLIVADEPVSALDVSIQAQIINLLADLQQEFGLTYLFISHAIPVIEHISTRIGVMYVGKLVEVGTSAQICLAPKHPYTQALLSAVPVPDPAAKKQRIILRGDVPTAINPPSGCRFHTRCPIAVDRCKIEEPPLRQLEDGRDVACHLV